MCDNCGNKFISKRTQILIDCLNDIIEKIEKKVDIDIDIYKINHLAQQQDIDCLSPYRERKTYPIIPNRLLPINLLSKFMKCGF